MLPATFRWGKSARLWNTMLVSRSYGGNSVTSRPPMKTRPFVGFSSPPIIRRIVDFPLPEGPRSVKKDPFSMPNHTSFTAVTVSSKTFVRPRTSTSYSGRSFPPKNSVQWSMQSNPEELTAFLSDLRGDRDKREGEDKHDR